MLSSASRMLFGLSMYDCESPIVSAVARNNMAELKEALRAYPERLNEVDSENGFSPLHVAIMRGNLTTVQFLLAQENIDLTIKDAAGRDSLELAIIGGHPKIRQTLFARRATDLGLDSPEPPGL